LTHPDQLVLVHKLQQHATDVQAPLQRMEHGLHPLVAHFILPVFALANAGVDLRHGFAEAASHPAAHGVFFGLLIGKPVGILLTTLLAAKLLGARLPDRVTWHHVHGVAWIAGIGFTMSLFIDSLAFAGQVQEFEASKIAILVASLLAGAIGFVLLRLAPNTSGTNPEAG
jgi:NhaA family Na+:H+ antiporter